MCVCLRSSMSQAQKRDVISFRAQPVSLSLSLSRHAGEEQKQATVCVRARHSLRNKLSSNLNSNRSVFKYCSLSKYIL